MKILILIALLVPSLCFSGGLVFSNSSFSDDTDGNTIFVQEAGTWLNRNADSDIGIAIRRSSFDDESSTRFGALYNKRFDKGYGINVEMGVETLFDEVTGKAKVAKWHDAGSIELNVERNFVDNVQSTQNGITYTMGYLLSEYHINDLIIIGVLGQTRFSDNPKRNEARLIASHPIAENTHIRLETQYYEFNSFSAFYFSPNEYYRYLAGLQHYQTISANSYILAKVLYGQQSVNGFTNSSYLVGLTTGHNFDRMPLEVKFEVTLDQKEPNYTYKIASLNLVYRF